MVQCLTRQHQIVGNRRQIVERRRQIVERRHQIVERRRQIVERRRQIVARRGEIVAPRRQNVVALRHMTDRPLNIVGWRRDRAPVRGEIAPTVGQIALSPECMPPSIVTSRRSPRHEARVVVSMVQQHDEIALHREEIA